MTSPTNEVQIGVAARLTADAGVVAVVADSGSGPAVFARGQAFDDVYARITLDAPQRIDQANGCSTTADMVMRIHSWAQGPDCTLVAGSLADAVIAALRPRLVLTGWRVSSQSLIASRSIGDPDPTIEHVVTEYRFTVHLDG